MNDRPMRLGVDLGGTKIEVAVLDPDGTVIARRRIPTPVGDYHGTVTALVALVEAMEAETGATCSVGVGTPGAIDVHSGRIKNSNSQCLIGQPLQRDIEQTLGRPVRLANDANCFALSEAIDGAAAGYPTVFGVILGTGVGGGLVVDGRPLQGAHGIAGEWGHNPLPRMTDHERPGPPCYCGRRGCIETFLSGPGMAADHRARHGGQVDAADIEREADAGDPAALDTITRYAERLARALAGVINVFDPHAIVLGGGVSHCDALYELVPRIWAAEIVTPKPATPLLRPRHGAASGVRGAAWLWG